MYLCVILLCHWCNVFGSSLRIVLKESTDAGQNCAIKAFHLSNGLRVVRYGEDVFDAELGTTKQNSLDVNWLPLSLITYLGGPYAAHQWLTNALETFSAVMVRIGTARVILVNRSVITCTILLPSLATGESGPRMTNATNSRGAGPGNNFIGAA